MSIATQPRRKHVWPDEELEALPNDGYKYELLDGKLVFSELCF